MLIIRLMAADVTRAGEQVYRVHSIAREERVQGEALVGSGGNIRTEYRVVDPGIEVPRLAADS